MAKLHDVSSALHAEMRHPTPGLIADASGKLLNISEDKALSVLIEGLNKIIPHTQCSSHHCTI